MLSWSDGFLRVVCSTSRAGSLNRGSDTTREVFAQNGIAGDILLELTDADLKELGLNLGDRKRLLKAIAALDPEAAQHRVESAKQITAPTIPREPERRQLTVMFVDLVGSTALSATLDPEDVREVIRAYQNTVAEEIEHFEGHVAKFMGDGVLAYFGWPRAYEDAADRALRAGMAITGAIRNLRNPAGEALSARVGIATGLVVVGDLVGEGASQEQAVVGERPNLAARLQVLAGPGGVATVFLASDAASYVTGAVLFADDERTAIDGRFTPPRDVSPRASAAAVGGAFTTRP